MDKHVWAAVAGGLALLNVGDLMAAKVEGTFTAVVTVASDPGQLSFGRDPADWVGREVSGTFSYDVDTVGVQNVSTASSGWTYASPAVSQEWVDFTATIDGVTFTGSPPDSSYFPGGTIQIWDNSFGGGDWYSVQSASVTGGGRRVVVFDVFGPATMFSYPGSGGAVDFDFSATPGVFGVGLIEDLYEPGGVVQRHGLIRFQLTSLTFGKSVEGLIEDLLTAVTGAGPGGSLADKMAIVQAYYAAGDLPAACAMLADFQSQVSAQTGKKLTLEEAVDLTAQAEAIRTSFDCE